MKLMKILSACLLMIAFTVISIACSNGKSPIVPSSEEISGISNDLPLSSGIVDDSRSLLAVYDAVIDPASGTFTIASVERSTQFHFALSQNYPNVLKITGYGFTPNLWADIKLVHPYPGSGIDAFDPRVIAILPANSGVRFIYPVMGVGGNNAVVLEPDGYTKLFDSLGGAVPGNVNPFKAYFKDQPYRVWSGTGVTEETQRWQMNIAGFGGPIQFKFVVDVSTNYPAPPAPVIDNAQEPYEIYTEVGVGLTNQGGSAPIEVRVKHWKDISEIGGVLVESPDLFNSTRTIPYYGFSPEYGASIFKGTLDNEKLAQEGSYKLMVKSWHTPSGIEMFEESSADVYYVPESGDLLWAKQAGGVSLDKGSGVTTLSDDSTVVTGKFSNTATFGLGESNETSLTAAGSDSDMFIARYNPDGTLAWAKRAGGPYGEFGSAITSLSDDSTIVTGYFYSSATFGQGEPNQTVLYSGGSGEFFIARYNTNGTLAWAKKAGGSAYKESFGITTLSDDSVVLTGWFDGTAIFGQGETNQTYLSSSGEYDVFIARYNSNGTLSWAKRAGGYAVDCGNGATSLTGDSTVITGYFDTTITFGPGEANQTVLTSAGGWEMFIARYNPNGTLAWAKRAGGTGSDGSYGGIACLSDDSTVVTGYFQGSAVFGEGEPNETIPNCVGNCDIFIARYNPDGTLAWVKSAGGSNYDWCYAVTAHLDDSILLTGEFLGSATFGAGEPNEKTLTGDGMFVARNNPDGTLQWAKRTGNSCGKSITALSDNSSVLTGWFSNSAIFGEGTPNETILTSVGDADIFIARLEP